MQNLIYRYRKTGMSLAFTLGEINGGLYLAPALKLNDPFDGLTYASKEKALLRFSDSTIPVVKEWTIACFSEKWDNPTMWAHYARFDGVCLVYDKLKITEWVNNRGANFSKALVSTGSKCYFDKVTYNQDMSKAFKDSLQAIYSKSETWKYEEEWRLAFQFPKENTGFSVNSEGLLKRIYLGPEIDGATQNAIVNIRNYSDKSIEIYKIKVSKDKQRLELGNKINP